MTANIKTFKLSKQIAKYEKEKMFMTYVVSKNKIIIDKLYALNGSNIKVYKYMNRYMNNKLHV